MLTALAHHILLTLPAMRLHVPTNQHVLKNSRGTGELLFLLAFVFDNTFNTFN